MSEAQDLIDELNMWIERGAMPRMTTAITLILLEEIKRLTAEAEKWRNTALQLSNNHGQARNKVDNLEADYIISNRELLILQVELARRDEIIKQQGEVSVIFQEQLSRRDEIIARLKENGERLAARPYPFIDVEHVESGTYCHYCHKSNKFDHTPDCPITLHRALMKELE